MEEAGFHVGHPLPTLYAVLVQVSLGYPPPSGRSLTYYSPVRRSTGFPKEPFSHDLHV